MDHFSLENNGYNRSEVNDFLSDVIKQTESIIEKCKVQSNEIEQLRLELEEYKNKENSMKDAIAKTEAKIRVMMTSIKTSKMTDNLANEMFLSAFFLATLAKAWISFVSLTKALITLIPVKFSWAKSYNSS